MRFYLTIIGGNGIIMSYLCANCKVYVGVFMQNKVKILSIVGIVLGALAIAFCLLELAVLGLVFGVAGTVLSFVVRKQAIIDGEPKLLATIGLTLSAIGVAACVVAIILSIINEIQKANAFPGVIDAEG